MGSEAERTTVGVAGKGEALAVEPGKESVEGPEFSLRRCRGDVHDNGPRRSVKYGGSGEQIGEGLLRLGGARKVRPRIAASSDSMFAMRRRRVSMTSL